MVQSSAERQRRYMSRMTPEHRARIQAGRVARQRERRGQQPPYRGPCIDGCGRPGRSRSARCVRCSARAQHRRLRFRRIMDAIAGEPFPAEWLAAAIRAGNPVAIRATSALLEAMAEGTLSFFRVGQVGRWPRDRRQGE